MERDPATGATSLEDDEDDLVADAGRRRAAVAAGQACIVAEMCLENILSNNVRSTHLLGYFVVEFAP